MSIITRFAPSPTGDLHIGGVRTALYNWLFAKQHQGKFILRIEDTDLARSSARSTEIILEGLSWLGLNWDEGPLLQSQRLDRYLQVATELLDLGLAYRCDCSKERLEQLRTAQMKLKQKPKYDNHCRSKNLPADWDQPYVIRFKTPLDGVVEFNDLIRGNIKTLNQELDDLILVRSDQTPTYNFTVVIDDLDLQITEVIRGEDHISNTPKQINILLALGGTIPRYAHIPMILGEDGSRLSKRHGASSILNYKKLGFLPEPILNYLARLGWSHKDQEIFSIEELIKLFNFDSVQKSPAIFNLDKLLWLNQNYIANQPVSALIQPLIEQFAYLGINIATKDYPKLNQIIAIYKDRVKTLKEMAESSIFVFNDDLNIELNDFPKILNSLTTDLNLKQALLQLFKELDTLPNWDTPEPLSAIIKLILQKFNLKFPEIAKPLRIAILGKEQGPSLDQILILKGKDKSLEQITKYIMPFIT